MDSRPATVDLASGDSEFVRALAFHMSMCTGSLMNFDQSFFDPPLSNVYLAVHGTVQNFAVKHVVTDYSEIKGVVLERSFTPGDDDEADNVLEYVLVKVESDVFTIAPYVYWAPEQTVVNNKFKILSQLILNLFD